MYDFPVLLNSPTPTSPDGTKGSVRSFDSELIFNAENDSGYSSSTDRFLRSNSDCSQDLRKELTSSYENCDPLNYEFMGPGISLSHASRPVPIPDKGHGSPHGVLSDPVSIPAKTTYRNRLSDPNPTVKSGFSKGRISDPEPGKKPGPFALTRRVSAKKLNSFSVPTKNAESSQCPLDHTTSVKSPKSNSGIESPPPLPPKKGTSRPNSQNSNSSSSPQKSPVLLPRSKSSKKSSIGESFANEMMTFIRSVSSDGFESEALKEAQRAVQNLSPSKNISSDDASVKRRSNTGGTRARSQTEVLSPSKKSPVVEIGEPGRRSNSIGGRTLHDRSKTEVYENNGSGPRSHNIESKSLDYENHVLVTMKDLSFQNYDNSKLKSVPSKEEPQSSPIYENHAITATVAKQESSTVTSSSTDGDGSKSLIKPLEQSMGNYDNHKLVKDNSKISRKVDRVSYENYTPKSMPQNYEKMVLRRSFIETEDTTENLETDKEVSIGDDSGSYENHSVGSQKSQLFYENFVLVEHSDIPEDISRDSANDLKCPSFENHGFSELEAAGKEALKTEETAQNEIPQTFQEKDNSDILSKSLPTCCDWKLVNESVNEDGSLSVLVEVVGASNLRKTSSDGDVSESKQTKKVGTRPESDDTSGPIPPPRWKKWAREAKKQQTRWSLTVGGELASVLSNYFHQHGKDLKDNKELTPQKDVDKINKQTIPPREGESVTSSTEEARSSVSERTSSPISDKMLVSSREDAIDKNASLTSSEQKLSTPEKVLSDIVSESQEVDSGLPTKNEASSSKVGLDSRPSQETPSLAPEKLTNGLDDVKLEEKPQRPNVLCFENKLAGFAEMFHSEINADQAEVAQDVPTLPPKKSPVSPPGKRNSSRTSQYPRLSRDSTNTKLSFEEDRQRYRPCPSNGSHDNIYDLPCEDTSEDAPPPLPRKVSKTKTAPDVPPRPDLACS